MDVVMALVQDIVARTRSGPTESSATATSRRIARSTRARGFRGSASRRRGSIPWFDEATAAERRARFERELPDVAWFQQRLAQHGFAVPQDGALDERRSG
jgi:N-acetylmuramoyl-L-alanine amidase